MRLRYTTKTVTSLSDKTEHKLVLLHFMSVLCHHFSFPFYRFKATNMIFLEDRDVGILNLSIKFELDRCTKQRRSIIEQKNYYKNKDTNRQTETDE